MSWRRVILTIAGLIAFSSLPRAADKAWEECGRGPLDQESRISGCTRVLERGQLESDDTRARAYNNRAHAHSARGERDSAIEDFESALRIDPEDVAAIYNRQILVGTDYDRDIRFYGELIQKKPQLAIAYFHRGIAYQNKGDHERAIKDFDEVIRFDANAAGGYFRRGSVYFDKGDYDQAIKDFDEAIKIYSRDANYFMLRGWAYSRKGDQARAIENFNEAVRLAPESDGVYIKRALAYLIKGEFDNAIKDYDQAIRLDPSRADYHAGRADAYRSKTDFQRAVKDYSKAIELLKNPEKAHWAVWYYRAVSYERLGKWPQAEADFLKAIELDPDQPAALNNLGFNWVDRNTKLKEALALIEKAAKLKPNDGDIIDSLGWAHYRAGEYQEAVNLLERATMLNSNGETFDHLGDAYWKLRRQDEARKSWEKALSLNTKLRNAENIKAKITSGLKK